MGRRSREAESRERIRGDGFGESEFDGIISGNFAGHRGNDLRCGGIGKRLRRFGCG